jgi:hypothetical protein
LPVNSPAFLPPGRGFFGEQYMAKSIQDIRDQTQKVLEKICGDDLLFVERILEQFDRDNGITPQVPTPSQLSQQHSNR